MNAARAAAVTVRQKMEMRFIGASAETDPQASYGVPLMAHTAALRYINPRGGGKSRIRLGLHAGLMPFQPFGVGLRSLHGSRGFHPRLFYSTPSGWAGTGYLRRTMALMHAAC